MRSPDALPDERRVAEIDRRAYDVTQNWFRRQPPPRLEFRGIPLGEVLRRHLWDLVGRALRRQHYPAAAAFEEAWLARERPVQDPLLPPPAPRATARRRAGRCWHGARSRYRLRRERPVRTVFVRESPRLGRVVAALAARPRTAVLTTARSHPAFRDALRIPEPPAVDPDEAEVEAIRDAVLTGLAAEGIELPEDDRVRLLLRIGRELSRIDVIDRWLDAAPAQALLLAGDNWPPFIDFVLLARRRGLPSVYLQHGLDCEHHFADEAYADAIAVWGPARRDRYRRDSGHQPRFLEVTGNPEFAGFAAPQEIRGEGDHWLWVTRPHTPGKCLSPSRSPREGVEILDAFVGLLRSDPRRRLAIKAHPHDYGELYRERIAAAGLEDRAQLVSGGLHDWIRSASAVFSEDSTGGLEAMLFGKPVVHVHFAPCAPTLPIADYAAGIAARDADGLGEAAARIERGGFDRGTMLEGQRAFIADLGGPLDGRAVERAVRLVDVVLEESGGRR